MVGTRGPIPIERQRRKATGPQPKPPAGTPTAVRRIFRQLAADLGATTPDSGVLLVAAEAQLIGGLAVQEMIDAGLLDEDKRHSGAQRRHPAMMVWKQAAEMRLAALRELGGTPLARLRLPEPETNEPANASELLGVWQVADAENA